MYAEVFHSRLKMARESMGATQEEIANVLKISRPTYTNYEAGRSEPNIETIALLARMYEVSVDWLFGLTAESHIGSLQQAREEIERQKILKKLEREAELRRKAWGT
jgi:transcriptional regulator with XRE-family HTH domain